MSRFRVGLMDSILAGRPSVDSYSRASYLAAVANRVDSYWVPDHINGQTPRPLWDPEYTASAPLRRSPDAAMEAWTLLGSLAARRRFNRVRLGVGVTDAGKRHPAVTAQAAATLNLMTRGRAILGIGPGERVGNEPYGVDWSKPVARFEEALAPSRALGLQRPPGQARFTVLSASRRDLRPAAVQGKVARDLDRGAWPPHAAGHRAVRRRMVPTVRAPAAGV